MVQMNMRKAQGAAFKAVKDEKTIAQLSSECGIHANQIRQWRKQLLEEIPRIFSDRRRKEDREREDLVSELYQQIGQLKVELDWLKKKSQLLR
jgi:transposase-like protein